MLMKMQFDSIVMTPMTATGEIQSNPIVVPLEVTENSIEASETSKELDIIGMCCGTKVVFGAKEVSGSMSGPLTSGIAAVVMQHVFGKFDSEEDATTDVWEASTVYAVGDMVNHSDGEHTLVCQGAGTSSSTEPTVAKVGKRITDNRCTWVAQKLLKKGTVNTNKKPRPVCIEKRFEQEDGSYMYARYLNVTFSKTTAQAVNSDVDMTWSIDATGASVEYSMDDTYEPLSEMTGAKKLDIHDDYFMNDEKTGGYCAYKDGVLIDEYEEVSFDIERTVEKSNAVPKKVGNEFVAYPPNVSKNIKAKGSMTVFATKDYFDWFYHKEAFDIKLSVKNNVGGSVTTTYKQVVPGFSDISIENCMDSKLSPELFVTGGCDEQSSVQCEVVYPVPTDTDGNVIAGGYPV